MTTSTDDNSLAENSGGPLIQSTFAKKGAAPSRPKTLEEFDAWLETQPPSGRSVEEIEREIREERDAWD